jgi:predicted MFS family arabinose efflux permease
MVCFGRNLLGYGGQHSDPLFVWPRGKVLFIGILCFIVFLSEGSMLDWSAVFLTSRRGMDPAQAGIGYAAFAVAMTAGRLSGDRVVQALGGGKIILWGGLCAAAGFLLAVLTPGVPGTLAGFTLVGLGASNIVPVLFTAAGAQKAMPVGLAVSAITTIGYAGILAGPAFIGFIARMSSLELSFALIAALLLAVSASARAVAR